MHFVKHSLAVAMLAILTGCGGGSSNNTAPVNNTPDTPDEVTAVSSVSPQSAVVGQLTTFTLSGQRMTSNLQVSLPNCQNISALEGSTTKVTFTCTPQTAGTHVLTVKTAAGATLFTGNINLQATAPAEDIIISSVEMPSNVTVGQQASFTIKGQNLSGTLQINLAQCQNITPLEITPTQIRFTCTPQVAGVQTLTILSAAGTTLLTRTVSVQSPPPVLSGSWRQTAAEGCTGSIDGETIVGVRSKKPLFTFISDAEKRVRLIGNEGFGYSTVDCSETTQTPATATTPTFALTTGIAKFSAVYDDVGPVQKINDVYYYPVHTTYSNNSLATPSATAIVFKNADTFCLFDGVVTSANVTQFIQNVDLTQLGCFARNSKSPFSQDAPSLSAFFSKSISALVQRSDGESILNLLSPINQRGQTGYVLLGGVKSLSPVINSNGLQTYNLFTQISVASEFSFEYRIEDEPAQDANFESNRLKQLNDLGLQGLLFLGKKQLNAFSEARTLYVKATPATGTLQAFEYRQRRDSDVTATKLIGILDAYGADGCRFVDTRLQATPANTRATVCVNSNRHIGTYSYRYVPYPESTRTDALKALLDTQKLSGFYPIRVMSIGTDATPHILFEYDSSVATRVQGMQYKVYSQALPSNEPELDGLLNDQGKLGWQLWSEIDDLSGSHLGTIFASLPFPHLPDGESVVLDRH